MVRELQPLNVSPIKWSDFKDDSVKTPMPDAGIRGITGIIAAAAMGFGQLAAAATQGGLNIVVSGSNPGAARAPQQISGQNGNQLANLGSLGAAADKIADSSKDPGAKDDAASPSNDGSKAADPQQADDSNKAADSGSNESASPAGDQGTTTKNHKHSTHKSPKKDQKPQKTDQQAGATGAGQTGGGDNPGGGAVQGGDQGGTAGATAGGGVDADGDLDNDGSTVVIKDATGNGDAGGSGTTEVVNDSSGDGVTTAGQLPDDTGNLGAENQTVDQNRSFPEDNAQGDTTKSYQAGDDSPVTTPGP
jgi:hypothetical protein